MIIEFDENDPDAILDAMQRIMHAWTGTHRYREGLQQLVADGRQARVNQGQLDGVWIDESSSFREGPCTCPNACIAIRHNAASHKVWDANENGVIDPPEELESYTENVSRHDFSDQPFIGEAQSPAASKLRQKRERNDE